VAVTTGKLFLSFYCTLLLVVPSSLSHYNLTLIVFRVYVQIIIGGF
jgi:hypothetical protein